MPADTIVTLHAISTGEKKEPFTSLVFSLMGTGFIYKPHDFMSVNERILPLPGIGSQITNIRTAKTHCHNFQDKTVIRAFRF
jgi:hypothetical protein